MTAPNRLRERRLERGRGRVYLTVRRRLRWSADYRAADGTLYGVVCVSASEAYNWIRAKAEELES